MVEMSGILIFLAGGLIGFVICFITLGKKQKVAQQQELDNMKAELEHYKSQVNNHFNNSAELMAQVASSYQALYTHMAGQSQALLSESEADALSFPMLNTPFGKKREEPLTAKEAAQGTAEETTQEVAQTDATEEAGKAAAKDCAAETSRANE